MITTKVLTFRELLSDSASDLEPDQGRQLHEQIEKELAQFFQQLDEGNQDVLHVTHAVIQLQGSLLHYYTIVYCQPESSARVKPLMWGTQHPMGFGRWGLDGDPE